MAIQRVNPVVLIPLREALATVYWYKNDLRDFLKSATGDSALVQTLIGRNTSAGSSVFLSRLCPRTSTSTSTPWWICCWLRLILVTSAATST